MAVVQARSRRQHDPRPHLRFQRARCTDQTLAHRLVQLHYDHLAFPSRMAYTGV
ncbi:hypothetical protein [Streptomyces sp. NPDC059761]|uniref:hypothetical protein n=1 Tax=Streptomyces sp. NPDC059761 TaxID=3346937 RepID=UPI0036670C87